MNPSSARRVPASKRVLDVGLTLVTAPVWLPVLGVAMLLVLVFLGRPVLFRQQRPGLGGEPFTLVKLRTMRSGGEEDGRRMTRLGRVLRALSLDELPELFLVLGGRMSLVGPRPLLMEYLPLYSPEQARRHEVLPGITGWAQVKGRNRLDWPEVFRLDVWYVDNRSLLLDLKILLLTLAAVFRFGTVSQPGRATRDKFTGEQ